MKALTTTLVVGMFLTTAGMAGDVDDVRAAEGRYYAAINSGDAQGWAQSRLAGLTDFGAGGGLLERSDSPEEARSGFQDATNAGLKYNVQQRHLEVRVIGNLTAVTTSYGVGRLSFPNGTSAQVNNRITRVWEKQGGQWKMAHQHISPVVLPQ